MDDELEQLSQKRLAELQQKSGYAPGASSAGASNAQSQQQQEEMRKQQQEMKNSILAQVLTQEARARCNLNLFINFFFLINSFFLFLINFFYYKI